MLNPDPATRALLDETYAWAQAIRLSLGTSTLRVGTCCYLVGQAIDLTQKVAGENDRYHLTEPMLLRRETGFLVAPRFFPLQAPAVCVDRKTLQYDVNDPHCCRLKLKTVGAGQLTNGRFLTASGLREVNDFRAQVLTGAIHDAWPRTALPCPEKVARAQLTSTRTLPELLT